MLGATAALVIQALLIAGLLYQRRARQRAEQDSRRSLTIAADASRRSTMSALSSSIAHELGQPLSSIIHNAEALQMMVSANRATSDTIGEILSDIRTQGVQATQIVDRQLTMLRSRQLEKKPIDLHAVINESVALVAHDMSEREIAATVQVSSNPCVISGDQVLLQQVLVNLMVNAMDAVAETAAGPASHHAQHRRQSRRCRHRSARHWNGFAGAYQRHAVRTIRDDEVARHRDRPDNRQDDRRRA